MGLPSRIGLPFSLMSKATALARRVEVVFKLMLYATRKSRAPTAMAPVRDTKREGPKSGFHCGLLSFLGSPSYSPARQLAKLARSGINAAFS
ncbi:hypothetical protein DSECCO2_615660 [anaerobic digester metagenome]